MQQPGGIQFYCPNSHLVKVEARFAGSIAQCGVCSCQMNIPSPAIVSSAKPTLQAHDSLVAAIIQEIQEDTGVVLPREKVYQRLEANRFDKNACYDSLVDEVEDARYEQHGQTQNNSSRQQATSKTHNAASGGNGATSFLGKLKNIKGWNGKTIGENLSNPMTQQAMMTSMVYNQQAYRSPSSGSTYANGSRVLSTYDLTGANVL